MFEYEINKALRSLQIQGVSLGTIFVTAKRTHVVPVMDYLLTVRQIEQLSVERRLNPQGIRDFAEEMRTADPTN